MKTLILLIACLIFLTNSKAQECSEDFKQVAGLWENLTLENALNNPESLTSSFNTTKENLAKSLGGLSLKSNAPKILSTAGKAKKGTIKKNKKKTYVTYMAPKATMEISIASVDDLAGLEVVICAHSKSNLTENLLHHTLSVEDTNKSFTVENVKGKVLSISLKNSGDKAQYTITAK